MVLVLELSYQAVTLTCHRQSKAASPSLRLLLPGSIFQRLAFQISSGYAVSTDLPSLRCSK